MATIVSQYPDSRGFYKLPVVKTPLMLLVAAIGLIADIAGLLLLRRTSRGNLNIKAAFWHVIGDTTSSGSFALLTF